MEQATAANLAVAALFIGRVFDHGFPMSKLK
jgi:hypothetical protein